MRLAIDLVVGLAVVVFGAWGMRGAGGLVSENLDEEARRKRSRVMRRGAFILLVFGVVLVGVSVTKIVTAIGAH